MASLWRQTYREAVGIVEVPATQQTAARRQIADWSRKVPDAAVKAEESAKEVTPIQARAAEYDGLPTEVCELLEICGTGLGNVLDRVDLGLPLSETERLIAAYAVRFLQERRRKKSRTGYALQRLGAAIGQIVQAVREDIDNCLNATGDDGETTADSDESDDDID